jgi:hypothetical protein
VSQRLDPSPPTQIHAVPGGHLPTIRWAHGDPQRWRPSLSSSCVSSSSGRRPLNRSCRCRRCVLHSVRVPRLGTVRRFLSGLAFTISPRVLHKPSSLPASRLPRETAMCSTEASSSPLRRAPGHHFDSGGALPKGDGRSALVRMIWAAFSLARTRSGTRNLPVAGWLYRSHGECSASLPGLPVLGARAGRDQPLSVPTSTG